MSFTRVTKASPCPICQHGDWCRVFADGWVECMRVQSPKPAKSGGWLHRQGLLPQRLTPLKPAHVAPAPTINAAKLMLDWRAATPPEALAEFAVSLGLSVASLTAVGAAWAAPHAAWAFPMADGHGNVVGIRLRNERGKFAVRGSRQDCSPARSAECGMRSQRRSCSSAKGRLIPPPPSSWAFSRSVVRIAVAGDRISGFTHGVIKLVGW